MLYMEIIIRRNLFGKIFNECITLTTISTKADQLYIEYVPMTKLFCYNGFRKIIIMKKNLVLKKCIMNVCKYGTYIINRRLIWQLIQIFN